ncbi:MAG: hypothetical protein ABIQ31_10235 [Ferruginibacter sp.]
MKRIIIALVLIVVVAYYFILGRSKLVTDENLVKVHAQKENVVISTMESAKYINSFEIQPVNENTVDIAIYTTSIYNIFSSKKAMVNITLDERIKYIIVAGKTIRKDTLVAN